MNRAEFPLYLPTDRNKAAIARRIQDLGPARSNTGHRVAATKCEAWSSALHMEFTMVGSEQAQQYSAVPADISSRCRIDQALRSLARTIGTHVRSLSHFTMTPSTRTSAFLAHLG